jgi:hypothetical protein
MKDMFDCIFIILGLIAAFAGIIGGVVLNNFSLVFVTIFIYTPIYLTILSHLTKNHDERRER